MRKMLSAALLMCMATLLSTLSMPTVLARPNGILKCELSMEINWGFLLDPSEPSFIGTVSGDINGYLYIYLKEASYPGKTEHFSEKWKIVTYDGDIIEGFDEGVWSFHNLKWVANGRVTSASGAWSYLVGANFQYSGTTTPVYGPPTPVYGTGTLHITSRP